MLNIDTNTNINKLLSEYPKLEEYLMTLSPKYKKLKNPILRKTVANIATLKQVALIGGFDAIELVNKLREQVGQEPLKENSDNEDTKSTSKPKWVDEYEIVKKLDAVKLLEEDKNPLAETNKALLKLGIGQTVLIKSDFLPSPLIDTFKEKGYLVWYEEDKNGLYSTYITKESK